MSSPNLRSFWILFVLLIPLFTPIASAQAPTPDFDRSRYSPASYYNYSQPGDITIHVNVWGTVRNPGLYEVPQQTTLSTLFSLAGGPAVTPRDRREERSIKIRLTRRQGDTPVVIFENTMEDGIFATREDPILQAGDVLTVETITHRPFSWREALPIISTAASVGIMITYFLRL